ncbi:MAG: aminoglycoside phosphotransferase family protein [Dehalococcoidia bacterium]|nr:MAG: aminoglycoside phosphotransferase family protein [Dehalococcoidia bacterium]
MHAGEHDIDDGLVRMLIAGQFPQWASLPLSRVASAGTDHALYRLGDEMSVRLPRVEVAAGQVEKEQRWLPLLAPHLPLAIPTPLAQGAPAEGYPWAWSVYRWQPGENAIASPVSDLHLAALDLAGFVEALHRVDLAGGPEPGRHNFFRGVPLAHRDASVRSALAALAGTIDVPAAARAWDAALATPAWQGAPVWIHGDLHAGNLLVEQGRISGVIDWGGLAVGDPACDLMVAWNFLDAGAREAFRAALDVDDATWERGRGWALSMALIALPYYRETNPVIVASSMRTLGEVLAASS